VGDLAVVPQEGEVFTADELQLMLDNLDKYSPEEIAEIDRMVDELDARTRNEAAANDFLVFCQRMQSDYIVGKHHKILADMLMAIERGDKSRICVNIPPRHGKSQMDSIFYPAWYLGRNPAKKVIMASHTTDLAVDFGRKVRNLINSDEYRAVFPNVALAYDSKSAGRWNTNFGGEYYACGVGSALAGRGAHLLIIDDPHSEQDIINGNYNVFDRAYQWFTFGARTRLMPNAAIAVVQTRWHMDDLTGRLIKDMAIPKADQYEVVEFPAILEIPKVGGGIVEKALWPEFFDLTALYKTKASMPLFQWNAQFQQNPTAEEAAIVKREWWKIWEDAEPPKCEYIIMSLDTASERNTRADFTALTTWGVFFNTEDEAYNIILLNSIKRRLEFPELKVLALEQYNIWEPDSLIVEKKSSGIALYQELRRMGIPVSEYTPHRGTGDKTARLNSVADIVKSGLVWMPQKRWAEEVVEEIAGFPFMSNDDLVDSTVMALMRFRQGGFIRLPSDEPEPIRYFKSRKGAGYY
jgi:predicted phage terminase large subunit-like protein